MDGPITMGGMRKTVCSNRTSDGIQWTSASLVGREAALLRSGCYEVLSPAGRRVLQFRLRRVDQKLETPRPRIWRHTLRGNHSKVSNCKATADGSHERPRI